MSKELPSMLCPIKPHELEKPLRRGLESIAERVAAAAVVHNLGKDLFLLIYLAGIYHGQELARKSRQGGS